MDNNNPIVVCF